MKKFWRITYILYRNALIRDSKISLSLLAGIITSLFDGFVSIAIIFLVYTKTASIGGWNIYETLVLISVMQIIIVATNSWTKKGTGNFATSMVRMGDYDFYLTKPFDPMLSVSISKPRIYNLIKLPFFIFIFFYAINHIGHSVSLANILWFLPLFVCGFLLWYAIRIITVVPAFWIVKSWELTTITDRVSNIIKYPANIYPRILNLLFSTAFPIFIVAYLPVKVLLFEPKLSYIIYIIFITIAFLTIARKFWKFGEKFYGSASS